MVCAFSEDMSKNKLLGNFGLNLHVYNKNLPLMNQCLHPPSSKKKNKKKETHQHSK